jgi:hypothetical protein
MKYLILPAILLFSSTLIAQHKENGLVGPYHDYFGSDIEINADSTFKYTWAFDLASSWSKGTWTVTNDTVYFKTIPIYDTLRYKDSAGRLVDSLILSIQKKPKLLTDPVDAAMDLLSGGGQNRSPCPGRLFYADGKLFGINKDGQIITQQVRGFGINKKYDTWYFKAN